MPHWPARQSSPPQNQTAAPGEWSLDKNCTRYDLEGIDPVGNPGVYAFKKKMGGREVMLAGKCVESLTWKGNIINYCINKIHV